ncbi:MULTISPECIES: hypothetical protein [unclassified Micromonospora]|uniref:hypothetical protein n=1 Tax=unclassified Micromonospora TaxID=2617518 RepID=UPI0010335C2C|nr:MULTISPECIES: hypothetical protein [unclassified Micromonospora]QKW16743.1 hypothetical protein HUT12_31070 [Verrucosispora sp. NA02020]TBL32612.1 hypothetical protein EYA84_18980 [Verrucosispora sp. SN26_14.1]
MTQPLILPVGRYTGEFHPEAGAPVAYYSLGIGRLVVTMEDPQAFAVWAAAHPPTDAPTRPWTRSALEESATAVGVTDPERIVDGFLEDGLLVEVSPDDPDLEGFARAHRVLPLMVSLGNSPDDPLNYGIGLFGMEPVVRVPTLVHDVWQWSSVGDSLWEVCEVFAEAGARVDFVDEREHDPRHVLREFLAALPMLLATNAACLDEARGL